MTTYLLPYTAGTVTTNGTTTVTGALTAWLANVKPGDRFRIGTSSGIVASVESNTSLTLEEAWSGSASGQSYAIDRWSRGWFSGGDLALALALYNTNRPTFIPTTGQPSDAVGADGNVAFDASANIFYVKSGGSWDGGTDIVGPAGADGADGEITRSGAQTGGLAKWASNTAISQATEITLSGGKVGIGTTSPSHLLTASATGTPTVATFQSDQSAAYVFLKDSGTTLANVRIGSSSNQLMLFSGGSERIRIDASGNVGIGTTSPAARLEVSHAESLGLSGPAYPSTLRLTNTANWGYGVGLEFAQPVVSGGGTVVTGVIQSDYESNSNMYMALHTMGSGTLGERVRISAAGNVGIGTTSPSESLSVLGRAIVSSNETNSTSKQGLYGVKHYTNAEEPFYGFLLSATSTTNVLFLGGASSAGNAATSIEFWTGATNTTTTGSRRAVINSSGALQLNSYGAGTLTTDASGNVTATSDERLKTDIRPFGRGLDDLVKISPIIHKWNAASGLDRLNDYAGFSAQDVEAAIPEAVFESANGFKSLLERPIVAALVNSVKELAGRVEELTARIASLEDGK